MASRGLPARKHKEVDFGRYSRVASHGLPARKHKEVDFGWYSRVASHGLPWPPMKKHEEKEASEFSVFPRGLPWPPIKIVRILGIPEWPPMASHTKKTKTMKQAKTKQEVLFWVTRWDNFGDPLG